MNANQAAIDALTPGNTTGGAHTLSSPSPGFNSLNGAPPYGGKITQVTWRIYRLPTGELHLIHFAPRL